MGLVLTSYYADFGPLVTSEDVNAKILDVLRYWLPTQIHQIEIERSLVNGSIARPKPESYATIRDEATDWDDHRLPGIFVMTSGTIDVQQSSADGTYFADYGVEIHCLYRGRLAPETQKYTSLFEGAVRRTMLMQSPLGPGRIWWLGTSPIRPVPGVQDSGRYMCTAVSRYKVAVDNVAQSGAGPAVPSDPYPTPPDGSPDQPYGPLVEVASVTEGIVMVPVTQKIGG